MIKTYNIPKRTHIVKTRLDEEEHADFLRRLEIYDMNQSEFMVKAVYVHAPDKSSGHRVQDVDISYNHIGILLANLLYDIMNGKAA